MSQSFNFPANPTLNQIVVLPDGNQAQWNGYTWVSVTNNVTYPLPVPSGGTGATNPLTAKRNLAIPIWTLDDATPAAPVFGDRWIRPGSMTEVVWLPNANPGGGGVWVNLADAGSVAYPIPVSKGGTGATTPAQARINLGIDYTTQPFLLQDGTVAAPGLAWNSEPGLGWFRVGSSAISVAAQGVVITNLTGATSTATTLAMAPRTAGQSNLYLNSQPNAAANYSMLALGSDTTGYSIFEALGGAATTKPLSVTFPKGVFFGATTDIFGHSATMAGQLFASQGLYSAKPTAAGEAAFHFWDSGTSHLLSRILSAANTGDIGIQFFNAAGAFESQPILVSKATTLVTLSDLALLNARSQVLCKGSFVNGAGSQCNTFSIENMSSWSVNSSGTAAVTAGVIDWNFNLASGGSGVMGYSFRQTGSTLKWAGPTTWDILSDIETKENISLYEVGLAEILQLVPKTYTRKMHRDMDPEFKPPEEVGLIAQDVQAVIARCVKRGLNGLLELNIDPILFGFINAFKTLDARLKAAGL